MDVVPPQAALVMKCALHQVRATDFCITSRIWGGGFFQMTWYDLLFYCYDPGDRRVRRWICTWLFFVLVKRKQKRNALCVSFKKVLWRQAMNSLIESNNSIWKEMKLEKSKTRLTREKGTPNGQIRGSRFSLKEQQLTETEDHRLRQGSAWCTHVPHESGTVHQRARIIPRERTGGTERKSERQKRTTQTAKESERVREREREVLNVTREEMQSCAWFDSGQKAGDKMDCILRWSKERNCMRGNLYIFFGFQ